MKETVLKQHPKYKGHIRWVKLNLNDKIYKIEKRRHFGWQSYQITKIEYDWIKTAKQAAKMWDFVHYCRTVSWFSGALAHPITGEKYDESNSKEERAFA
jgi:hypothetical protein